MCLVVRVRLKTIIVVVRLTMVWSSCVLCLVVRSLCRVRIAESCLLIRRIGTLG